MLKDHGGGCHYVELPPGTIEVCGVTVSGDEILIWPVYYDPMWRLRFNDCLDGPFHRVFENGKWVEKEIIEVEEKSI